MSAEIAEQPQALARTLENLLPRCDDIARLADGRGHVLLVARGSSDNAAVYARYLIETTCGLSAALAAPSVATHYVGERDLSDTLVVSISQSGETEEIVATQAWAHERGGATVAIANVADSRLVREADLALVTQAGPELAVPATKSYLTQLAALAVVAVALAPDDTTLRSGLQGASAEVERLLGTATDHAVDILAGAGDVLVTGRGIVLGTALETALKFEETCLRPVRGLSYADLRHGPIAIVDPDVVAVLVAAGDGPLVDGMAALAGDLRERGAAVLGIGGDAAFRDACDACLPGPALPEALAPLGLIVPAQLTIESLARTLGLDPDAPRGLSKVTRTDAER
ncbi:SIS domain-containing protein [Solicola gregarius]|uniref:SIS domain-containing protein n=1 Tax=Solicola gregarius TaxID=2908642 RepID=A0AA46TLM5_9ACTN|nr:SIS domain-containing protein [Solicola gregarius]UYM07567.1 SIS domain-containing protein [Solicola gregarius]